MSVAVPSDQFQKRTYVRLPYSDAFLSGNNPRHFRDELRLAFHRPLVTVQIAVSPVDALVPSAQPLALPHPKTPMYGGDEGKHKP